MISNVLWIITMLLLAINLRRWHKKRKVESNAPRRSVLCEYVGHGMPDLEVENPLSTPHELVEQIEGSVPYELGKQLKDSEYVRIGGRQYRIKDSFKSFNFVIDRESGSAYCSFTFRCELIQ